MPPKSEKTKAKNTKKSDADLQMENNHEEIIAQKNLEIHELQEKLRLLSIENEALRKIMKKTPKVATLQVDQLQVPPSTPARKQQNTKTTADTPISQRRLSTLSAKRKTNGCSCKGNCSSNKCGCVKKEKYCSESCKCTDECRNANPDGFGDEDKENERKQDETVDENKEDNVNQREIYDSDTSSAKSSPILQKPEDDDHLIFRPTKTLARSPLPNQTEVKTTVEKKKSSLFSPENGESPRSTVQKRFSDEMPLKPKQENKSVTSISEGDESPEVDWIEHTKQLVPCTKCKRKFFPDRKVIHEAACKNI